MKETLEDFSASLFFELMSDSTDDYIFVLDFVNNIFTISDKVYNDFSLSPKVKENVTKYWVEIMHPDDIDLWNEDMKNILEGKSRYHNMEYRIINKYQEIVWVSCRGKVEVDENGSPKVMVGRISNIGVQNKFDNVTGIKNGRELEIEMNRNITTESFKHGTFIFMDVDDFKNFNERYGHAFGDKLLYIIVEKVSQQLPQNCQLFRLDGDGFACFLPFANEKETYDMFGKIQLVLTRNLHIDGKQIYCTLSAGACLYPQDGKNFMDLFRHAESALEIAKINGKNQVTFFSRLVHDRKLKIIEIQEALHSCVYNNFDEFELYYQPQIDTKSKAIVGAEALLRWHSKKFGEVSPVEFIPLLEASNLIVEVGKWVFNQAIVQCKEWQKINKNFTMSINVSYIQLKESALKQYLKEEFKKHKLEPKTCILELTENCWIPDLDFLNEGFKEIQTMGYDIAIDDFGTGYSSLNYLKHLPVNLIKIDRSFVQGMLADSYEYSFLEYIIKLAHIIDLKVCVEGIETWEEFNVVEKTNPDYIQGFLFGRPVNAETFYKNIILSYNKE